MPGTLGARLRAIQHCGSFHAPDHPRRFRRAASKPSFSPAAIRRSTNALLGDQPKPPPKNSSLGEIPLINQMQTIRSKKRMVREWIGPAGLAYTQSTRSESHLLQTQSEILFQMPTECMGWREMCAKGHGPGVTSEANSSSKAGGGHMRLMSAISATQRAILPMMTLQTLDLELYKTAEIRARQSILFNIRSF